MNRIYCALVLFALVLLLQGCARKLQVGKAPYGFEVSFGTPKFWTDSTTGPDRCEAGSVR